jgi:hypothetical protein
MRSVGGLSVSESRPISSVGSAVSISAPSESDVMSAVGALLTVFRDVSEHALMTDPHAMNQNVRI